MQDSEENELREAFRVARKQILDLLQVTYGHDPTWRNARSRLPRIFGRDGLQKFNTIANGNIDND